MPLGARTLADRIMGTVMAIMGAATTGMATTGMARLRPISRAPSPWESC